MVVITILSDPICPWCLIGKEKFDRALKKVPSGKITAFWAPFQLNPQMPLEGMDRRLYLNQKFGGHENAINVYKPIVNAIIESGLIVNFDKIVRTPNTLDAHRLIYWAQTEGVQTEIVSLIFQSYFENGEDISDHKVLMSLAKNVGMSEKVVSKLLQSNSDKDLVLSMDTKSRIAGVTAVPTFIIDEIHVIAGAQEEDFWTQTFNEILN